MNERGLQFVRQMRRPIAILPGASGSSIFEGRMWTLVTITAITDDACFSIALLLGLREPKERRINTDEGPRRWLHATGEMLERTSSGRVRVQLDIVGPVHAEGPT